MKSFLKIYIFVEWNEYILENYISKISYMFHVFNEKIIYFMLSVIINTNTINHKKTNLMNYY